MTITAEQIRRLHGDRLRSARLTAGYDTAVAFARKIGVTSQAVLYWESGQTSPNPAQQLKIVALLGVKHSEIFGLDEVA